MATESEEEVFGVVLLSTNACFGRVMSRMARLCMRDIARESSWGCCGAGEVVFSVSDRGSLCWW